MEPSNLALFSAAVLACSILLYVFLDGFDLGVGVLFGATRNEVFRSQMMHTIAPFWDGNQTWLVVIGAVGACAMQVRVRVARSSPYSSARAKKASGIVRPIALAAFGPAP